MLRTLDCGVPVPLSILCGALPGRNSGAGPYQPGPTGHVAGREPGVLPGLLRMAEPPWERMPGGGSGGLRRMASQSSSGIMCVELEPGAELGLRITGLCEPAGVCVLDPGREAGAGVAAACGGMWVVGGVLVETACAAAGGTGGLAACPAAAAAADVGAVSACAGVGTAVAASAQPAAATTGGCDPAAAASAAGCMAGP